jgi:hypothetical protein
MTFPRPPHRSWFANRGSDHEQRSEPVAEREQSSRVGLNEQAEEPRCCHAADKRAESIRNGDGESAKFKRKDLTDG